jgi:hypothetical protein
MFSQLFYMLKLLGLEMMIPSRSLDERQCFGENVPGKDLVTTDYQGRFAKRDLLNDLSRLAVDRAGKRLS